MFHLFVFCLLDYKLTTCFIAIRYGVKGPGIEIGGGEIFRTCPVRLRSPPILLNNGFRVFPGGKAAEAWR